MNERSGIVSGLPAELKRNLGDSIQSAVGKCVRWYEGRWDGELTDELVKVPNLHLRKKKSFYVYLNAVQS